MAGITPGTEGASALKNRWDAVFRTKANEEMVIANDFDSPQGVEMIGDRLWVRIVPIISMNTLASTAQGQGAGILYHTTSISRVSAVPTFIYGAVQLPDHLVTRLGSPDSAQLEAKYRSQLLAALDAQVDADAGTMIAGFSAVKGPSNIDKVTLLDAQTTLATNAKQHYVAGSTQCHLKYHPSQMKNVNAIAEVANANFRGDTANPNVRGVILKAWGMTFAETGSVQFSAGNYQNALFVPSAVVLAWNRKPYVKPAQDFELTHNIYGQADYGFVEVFDEDGVTIKSA